MSERTVTKTDDLAARLSQLEAERDALRGEIERLTRREQERRARVEHKRAITRESESGAVQSIADQFAVLYYREAERTWANTYWFGQLTAKCPFDLWMYQELLYRLKPDLIIETGTLEGGSASYFASLCDLIGHGEIVTVDIEERPNRPVHPRITYLTGSSTSEEIMEQVRARSQGKRTVMVILDSDHTEPHVRRELDLYSALVTPGSYLVVEDTNINGHPVFPHFGPGPMEAVQDFLTTTDLFEPDPDMERHLVSHNPKGWLRRRGSSNTPE